MGALGGGWSKTEDSVDLPQRESPLDEKASDSRVEGATGRASPSDEPREGKGKSNGGHSLVGLP